MAKSVLEVSDARNMRAPQGWLRALYVDQTEAKRDILRTFDALPDDRDPTPEELTRCLDSVDAQLRRLTLEGPQDITRLRVLFDSQLRVSNKGITPRILNGTVPDRRIRAWVVVAYVLLRAGVFAALSGLSSWIGWRWIAWLMGALAAFAFVLPLAALVVAQRGTRPG